MEHIGNYLDKYRKMIAEYDEREDAIKQIGELGRQLEAVAIDQGKAIKNLEIACNEALEGLAKLKESYGSSK